jgi:regulation of enolase protein 1 (concanavalin A-like superfamily)
MDCPTCFQKITVPQAPTSADQKFILTGSKVEEKRPSTLLETASFKVPRPTKEFPAAAALVLFLVILAAVAGVYFFTRTHSRWKTTDIGTVGVAGKFSQQEETFNLAGAGADIWNQTDAFHFVSRSVNGDFSLTAHVVGLQETDPWAKAGLMVRETFEPDSANALICVTASNGAAFQARTNSGAQTESIRNSPRLRASCWLRLTRQGNKLTAETSANGKSWKPAGSTTMAMKKSALAGLAVCSHNSTTVSKATFDHVALNPASVPVAQAPAATNPVPGPEPPKPPAQPTAPPANDTNWKLMLDSNTIPDGPVFGLIHGQDFIMDRASFQNGSLTLRAGTRGPVELGVSINLSGALAEELSGKTLNVTTNAEKAAKVTLRWKDETGTVQKPGFDGGYALRLQFGTLANNRLPGKIQLCLPDPEKSYLLGSFNANASKPKPKPEQKAPPKQ